MRALPEVFKVVRQRDMSTVADIVDCDALADATGVSRRTIIRAAQRHGGYVLLGNKSFVDRSRLRDVLGGRWTPDVEKTPPPVRGKHKCQDAVTLQDAATEIGCSRSTVLRIVQRYGLGVQMCGRRYLSASEVGVVRASILPAGVTERSAELKREKKSRGRTALSRGR